MSLTKGPMVVVTYFYLPHLVATQILLLPVDPSISHAACLRAEGNKQSQLWCQHQKNYA